MNIYHILKLSAVKFYVQLKLNKVVLSATTFQGRVLFLESLLNLVEIFLLNGHGNTDIGDCLWWWSQNIWCRCCFPWVRDWPWQNEILLLLLLTINLGEAPWLISVHPTNIDEALLGTGIALVAMDNRVWIRWPAQVASAIPAQSLKRICLSTLGGKEVLQHGGRKVLNLGKEVFA